MKTHGGLDSLRPGFSSSMVLPGDIAVYPDIIEEKAAFFW